jgi:glutamyl-tRNA reductase
MIATSPDQAPPAVGRIVALVAHARSVPSIRREAFGDALRGLSEDASRLVIRTCHRVEVYATAGSAEAGALPELPPGGRRLEDVEAVQHLIEVACGVDSTVFGETQILHQLRELIEDRHGARALDPVLDRLLQASLHAGREARTFVQGSPRSLADVALDRIADVSGPIAGRRILVAGVGRMGRLAALAAHRRDAQVVVANRTASRAAALAAEVAGTQTPFAEDGHLEPVAGAILALAGTWPLGEADLTTLVANETPVVDLSSPPSLDATARERLGPRLVSVDDLALAGEEGPSRRVRARLERLISRAGADYCQWLRTRESVPAIRAVVETAERRRREELTWLHSRLPDLSPDDVSTIEQMSHRLVAAILHAPLTALTADEDGDLEPAARELFGL